jgi:hypothetical protein
MNASDHFISTFGFSTQRVQVARKHIRARYVERLFGGNVSEVTEGGDCPTKCGGTLHYPKVQGCRCHISPPCSACVDNPLTCNTCGWEEERHAYEPISTEPVTPWVFKKPSHDLGNGKRIFDYTYDSRSGSTMVFKGRYEGEVTPDDIIACLGSGTFGHRGPAMMNGHFTYTKVTD